MPRVCLTEAQRAAGRDRDRINRLADGLTANSLSDVAHWVDEVLALQAA